VSSAINFAKSADEPGSTRRTAIDKPRLQFWVGEPIVDFSVERRDDIRQCIFRRSDALPMQLEGTMTVPTKANHMTTAGATVGALHSGRSHSPQAVARSRSARVPSAFAARILQPKVLLSACCEFLLHHERNAIIQVAAGEIVV
jgi:hypothetical protein